MVKTYHTVWYVVKGELMSREKARPKTGWLEVGLKILTNEGPASLSIEKLMQYTGKTKGSFYHHFGSREKFIEQLLDYYERSTFDEIIEVADKGSGVRTRFKRLKKLTFQLSSDLELAIRAWALYNPAVKTFQDRLDRRRLEYLRQLYIGTGIDADRARTLSYRDYSLFIGLQQLRHHQEKSMFSRMLEDIFS